MRHIGIIILAAGGSSRLGRPKQLLQFEGSSLIARATQSALASICRPVVVVLGAHSKNIQGELAHLPVALAHNSNWKMGMGSSIKVGLQMLASIEAASAIQTQGVLLMLGDQPFVTPGLLNELASAFVSRGGIVASQYDQTIGVPAIFARDFYPELATLSSEQGAKCLIERHRENIHAIDFPEGAIDIDTQKDYARLIGDAINSDPKVDRSLPMGLATTFPL